MAPPLFPTTYGKRQMFAKPTADPAAANTKPTFELHASRIIVLIIIE